MPQRPGKPPHKGPRKEGKPAHKAAVARARREGGGGEGWLYGRHPVEAALANPARVIREVLGTAEALAEIRPLLDERDEVPVVTPVDRARLDDLLPAGAVHQGLALKADPLPAATLDDVVRLGEAQTDCVVLALDQVTDPHNVGAILRSAAAFGAVAVVTQDRHAPDETATLAKAASGALERVPLVRVGNLKQALDRLKEAGWWTAGLDAEAPQTLAGAKLSGRIVLVLGSEGTGMRRLTRDACDHLARLPMTGAMESLNVSNAAAVALYELRRTALEG